MDVNTTNAAVQAALSTRPVVVAALTVALGSITAAIFQPLGGSLTGTLPNPVVAQGAITAAQLALGAAVGNGAMSPGGPADQATIANLAGGPSTPLSTLVNQGYVDLARFDAQNRGCDGAHDSGLAIQAAVTYLSSAFQFLGVGDGVLRLPPGYCLVNETITGTGPVTIEGVGRGVGPSAATAGGGTYIVTGAGFTTGDVFKMTPAGYQGVVFKNLSFDALAPRTSGATVHIVGGGNNATATHSHVDHVGFLNQYDDIDCDDCAEFHVTGTVHQAWSHFALRLGSVTGTSETSAWVDGLNYFFGNDTQAAAQPAAIYVTGGYTYISGNLMVGSQKQVWLVPTYYQSAVLNVHDQSMEEATVSEIYLNRNGLNWALVDIHDVEFSSIATAAFSQSHVTVAPAGQVYTATTTAGSATLTGVSYPAGAYVGQGVSGAGIPSGTTITAISGSTLTMSAAATASASNVGITQTTPWINEFQLHNNHSNSDLASGYQFNIDGVANASISGNHLNNNGAAGYGIVFGLTNAAPLSVSDNQMIGFAAGHDYYVPSPVPVIHDVTNGILFGNLPAAGNGSCFYVPDGTTGSTFNAALTGGGTGAFAGRLNGAWQSHC